MKVLYVLFLLLLIIYVIGAVFGEGEKSDVGWKQIW
jgi:Na+-transporting methylmalonyl-CoA/oxaloacetate decarboxylase gamma subunit